MQTIQDRSLNVQVYRQLGEREVRNRLDVASVVNNKLHIIESVRPKACVLISDDTLQAGMPETCLGGHHKLVPCWLASPSSIIMTSLERDLGLALIGPDELKDLKTHLTAWFTPHRW
ncbi:DUF1887 family CARF protein [Vibrio lentus]|nr:DUF1887 family CARF protein [Vibrio lentus]